MRVYQKVLAKSALAVVSLVAGWFLLPLLSQKKPLPGSSGSISLGGIEVQSAEVEEDVRLEPFFVPIPKGLLDE